MKLRQVKNIVKNVLEQNEEARRDNFILVQKVYENLGVSTNMSFNTLVKNHEILELPSFESICRARRKTIESFPELNGNEEIRREEEKKYIEFVREN